MHSLSALVALGLAGSALSATFDVDVGNGGFVFSPSTLEAAVGDTVNFHFYAGDHSVAQSQFSPPCVPSGTDAIFSGFINPTGSGEASTQFSMMVNTTDPIWLYCSQVSHCKFGMSMVINPPNSTIQTLAAYQKASGSATGLSPSNVFGGVIEPNSESSESSSSSSAAASTASSSASAASTSAAASASTTASSSTLSSATTTSATGSATSTGSAGSAASRSVGQWWSLVALGASISAWMLT